MSKDNDVNEYAFSKVTLTATNKEDFENILKSLKLKESLGLDTLSMENIDKLVEKNPNYNTDLKFLDLSKGAMLKEHENPYLKLYNERDNTLNLIIKEDNFSINMHLQDTYMHDSKFGDLNEYIKDTFKDIAKQNSSELLFIHSEERFADRTGHTINFDETNKYDKTGKDITPDIFKELNSYKIDNNDIIKSKPTYEDLSKMIEDSEKKKPFKLKEKEQSKNQDMER